MKIGKSNANVTNGYESTTKKIVTTLVPSYVKAKGILR